MFYFALSCAQIPLFLDMLRRLSATSAAILCASYVMMTQMFFIYRAKTFDSALFPVGSYGSFYFRTDEGVLLYFAVFLVIYVSTLGVAANKSVNLRQVFSEDRRISAMLGPAALAISVVTLTRLMTVDPEILWSNNQYLLIASRAGLVINNPIFALAATLSGVTMVLAGVFFACAILMRNGTMAVILGANLFALNVIALAGASRTAVIPAAAVAVTLFLFGAKKHKIAAGLLVLLGLTFVAVALIGRSIDEFGISSIPKYFVVLLSEEGSSYIGGVLLNLSQGIFVTTDSIYLGGSFPLEYKVLSFSPFPSLIDGFNAIRTRYQIRLHLFVPMSAFGEVYNFGWMWVLGFALFLGALFRANAKMDAAKNPFISIISSLLIFVFFVMANAYPMRNVFRQFLIAYLLIHWPAIWAVLRQPIVNTWPKERLAGPAG